MIVPGSHGSSIADIGMPDDPTLRAMLHFPEDAERRARGPSSSLDPLTARLLMPRAGIGRSIKGVLACAVLELPGATHRLEDVVVGAATAQIAAHRHLDLLGGGIRVLS